MKDLVRLRQQVNQYYMMESQMKSMSMQLSSMQTQSEITMALRGATATMGKVNEKMDIKEIMQVMKQFNIQQEKTGMKMEMMQSATEDLSGDVEAEADDQYNQVLGEIGLEMVEGQAVPAGKVGGKTKAKEPAGGVDLSDLEKQLNDLKGQNPFHMIS
eukprot:TRINITY_DN2346_c0_g2_i4.p1 TRINITY_DN2346_c0_g2~~TRINITY_DN2346_c0_g2_i4.p1  ORF type:complete len:158 (-),score=37.19 TRINITY_DN2346_c0_g2_i4:104-577(-)